MVDTDCVAVVVPLQDEESTVETLLLSLAAQTRLPDLVVLVDAGSTDLTVERIRAFRAPFPLELVRAARVFPGTARNTGVAHTTADWVAFTDGGIVAHPDWLRELLAAAKGGQTPYSGTSIPFVTRSFVSVRHSRTFRRETSMGRGAHP